MATTHHRPYDAGRLVRLPLNLQPQPEGGFTITSPIVPELITEADTVAEVLPNVLDAWQVALEIYQEEGRSLPAELCFVDDRTGPVSIDALVPR